MRGGQVGLSERGGNVQLATGVRGWLSVKFGRRFNFA